MAVPKIPLPYGKRYHIFMSFCSEDQEIALPLIDNLENHYQLKCLNHIRDFVPGVSSVENILNGIENSMKIVYLVSKKFKDSQLCGLEILYGIKASHDQCENSMIPVLLEKTKMPRELETINYVNATITGTDIASKIYDACLFGACMEEDRPECETASPAAESSRTRGQPSLHM
ncbi:toll-like receptor 6, partial [Saccostrea cucullata]|uniref:toll-like receptor 6 n=1 Tax=Saccostrea cuccullata TaxID=36930 RepID=UPI002ED05BE9